MPPQKMIDGDDANAPKDGDADQGEDQTVDFPMPEGFQPPDGTKPGAEFHALATLKVDEDGDLNLIALDGAQVKPESDEDEENEDQTQTGGMADVLKQKLSGTGMPA